MNRGDFHRIPIRAVRQQRRGFTKRTATGLSSGFDGKNMWWPTNQRRTVQVRRFGFSGFRQQGDNVSQQKKCSGRGGSTDISRATSILVSLDSVVSSDRVTIPGEEIAAAVWGFCTQMEV
ncbi:hypothetical protein OROMI_004181 [Orobanche minor]